MPRVSDEYRSAKRDEIADAAMRAFRRRGFQGTSMADIIGESGLSAGAIYGHFAGKSDIVLAVAQRVVGSRVIDVERVIGGGAMFPPSGLIPVLVDGMLQDIGDPTLVVQLWGEAGSEPQIGALAAGVFGQLRDVYLRYISLWHQREHGVLVADADALAADQVALFVSAAQGFILQSALMPDFDREAYLTTLDRYLPR
jgi:AcrR family transcriptional regulator